jgi:hypothetical protein
MSTLFPPRRLPCVFNPIYEKEPFILSGNSEWFAPPLETANLVATALFFIVTILQLVILLSYLCRGPASHMAPAAFVIANAFFLLLSYIMGIVTLVIEFTVWGGDLSVKTLYSVRTGTYPN